MAANTWNNSSADGKWSTAANWSLGHVPDATETATFDATSVTNCAADDATPCLGIDIKATYSGVITQGANDINIGVGGFTMAGPGPTFTGEATQWMICAGDFSQPAGTVTDGVLRLYMTGSGKALSTTAALKYLKVSGSVAFTSASWGIQTYSFENYGTLSIATGKILYSQVNAGVTNTNGGVVSGAGTWYWMNIGTDNAVVTPGAVSCILEIRLIASAAGSRTTALAGELTATNTVLVISDHATEVLTLDLNGHKLNATTITASTRGILLSSLSGASIKADTVAIAAVGQIDATNIDYIRCDTFTNAGTYTGHPNRIVPDQPLFARGRSYRRWYKHDYVGDDRT